MRTEGKSYSGHTRYFQTYAGRDDVSKTLLGMMQTDQTLGAVNSKQKFLG